jgi:hypothetical protein
VVLITCAPEDIVVCPQFCLKYSESLETLDPDASDQISPCNHYVPACAMLCPALLYSCREM